MNKLLLFAFIVAFTFGACTNKTVKYETQTITDTNGYTYETVSNDPLKTRVYTLKNGLKIYLSQNTDEPRVTCLVGVRAGSTSDPEETTGLAHYFEHMMFKGTPRLGTVNWDEESKLIEQIEALYEKHRATNDPAEKKDIYKEIDRVSNEAAKYVATNEYDKLMTSLGAKNTNAGTSYESTIYINDVPVNELEKWAMIESERFHGIVLRLFHTELETVYEEFNMYQDMDSERAFAALMDALFNGHPYSRDVIGYPEDIKNPSMINIQNFFKTYYVPNNMAIALSGDIDYEATIKLIEQYFGDLKYNDLPERKSIVLKPQTEIITKEVVGPESANVMMAYRMGGVGSADQPYCDIIDMLLSNRQAGLIDLNLVQQQKVLDAGSFYYALKDYGIQELNGTPREGQTLEEVVELLNGQLDRIKKGEFDEWLIQAVINDIKLSTIRRQERNISRTYELMNNFIDGLSRSEALSYMNKLEKITKDDVVKFANEKYNNNYVVVYKRQGENANLVKVDKPEITSIPINRDLQSDFAEQFIAMNVDDVKPIFIDFNEKIEQSELQPGCNYFYIKNEANDYFALRYIMDMGKWNDLKFDLAVGYLKFIGTNKFSAPDLQKELYKYGLDLSVSSADERSYITISGLNSSFEKGVELLEHVIANAKADQQSYNDYVNRILKERADQKADQNTILFQAMYNYGMYGSSNPHKYIIGEEELKAVNPDELTTLLAKITTYKHKVFYYGPAKNDEIKAVLKAQHKLPEQLTDVPAPKIFVETDRQKNSVYVVDYDINQANIILLNNGDLFNKELIPVARIFNEYYGSGLSSVVFQEIRESKALAYTAFASYRMASKPNRRNSLMGYLGTQSDKLPIATETLIDLLNNMPKAEKQYSTACEAIVKKINTERIIKENIFWTWQNNLDRGIDYDIRKDEYQAANTMTIDEFEQFFNTKIKGQKYTYLVFGKKDKLDQKALSKLGDVEELSLTELFGY